MTESESVNDDDYGDMTLVVKHYADTDLDTSNDIDQVSLSDKVSIWSEYTLAIEVTPSISCFELYIAFYSIAFATFLAFKILPTETRSCISHLCRLNCQRTCIVTFKPAEALVCHRRKTRMEIDVILNTALDELLDEK
jgi:hypothetical protein